MKRYAAGALMAWYFLISSGSHNVVKEGLPTFCTQAVNQLLKTSARDDITVRTEIDIFCSTQLL